MFKVVPPAVALRAAPTAGPLTASEDPTLVKALEKHAVKLELLFGPGQFRPERRVAGPRWTRARDSHLLYPYYQLREADGRSAEELFAGAGEIADDLRSVADVDAVFGVPSTVLPVMDPSPTGGQIVPAPEAGMPTGDLSNLQGYLGDKGVNALAARGVLGAAGHGVRIVDIESAWCWRHEDLLNNIGGVIAGFPPEHDVSRRNHGTAVLGIMGADLNPFGTIGICPDAVLSGVSVHGPRSWGPAAAITAAANALAPGDIILIELQRSGPGHEDRGPTDQYGSLAMEYWPEVFAAIRYATRNGIIVVEAAGNGSQQLDDDEHDERPKLFPLDWHNPFNVDDGPNSGAVLVGAGAPPRLGADRPPDSRLGFSNWGARVDAQGWGEAVVTTGGTWKGRGDLAGGPDETRWYTKSFNGTSSAAPMVAGALACVQGALRAAGHRPLTPAQAQRALRETGARQSDAPGRPASQRIGTRPDIPSLITWALQETPRTTGKRRKPMRVQITIDDSDGSVSASAADTARPGVESRNGGPDDSVTYWRGPFYFATATEAEEIELPGASSAEGRAPSIPWKGPRGPYFLVTEKQAQTLRLTAADDANGDG
jgi:hypothetical protein